MQRAPWIRPAIGTGALLLIPLVMTLVDRHKAPGEGWAWGPADFLLMGLLLFAAGLAYEGIAHRLRSRGKRIAAAIVLACIVFLVWIELAVDGISQLVRWLTG